MFLKNLITLLSVLVITNGQTNLEYNGAGLNQALLITANAVKNLQNLKLNAVLSPLTMEMNDYLNLMEKYSYQILEVATALSICESPLSNAVSLNSIITDPTLQAQLNTLLTPHRTKIRSFFTVFNNVPLEYSNIFSIFGNLNGTIDAVFEFIEAYKRYSNALNAFNTTNLKELAIKLSKSNVNVFEIGPAKSEAYNTSQFWTRWETNILNNPSSPLFTFVTNLTPSRRELLNNLFIIPELTNIQSNLMTSFNNILSNRITVIDDLAICYFNETKLSYQKLVELEPLIQYLTCPFLQTIELSDVISTQTSANIFRSESIERLFRCNPSFVYNAARSLNTVSPIINSNVRALIVDYYVRYQILMGKFMNFADIADYFNLIPFNTIENAMIYNMIIRQNTPNILASVDTFKSFQSAFRNIDPVLLKSLHKYALSVLEESINTTWSIDVWSIYNLIVPNLGPEKIERYLSANRRYLQQWQLFSQNKTANEWAKDCSSTLNYYNFLIKMRDTFNDNSITYDTIKQMIICKTACDFPEWTNNTSVTVMKNITLTFVPYYNDLVLQSCRGTPILTLLKPNTIENATVDEIIYITKNGTIPLNYILTTLEIARLPSATVTLQLPFLSSQKIDIDSARSVLTKIYGSLTASSLTRENLKTLGTLYIALPLNTIRLKNSSEIRDNLNSILFNINNADTNTKFSIYNTLLSTSPTKQTVLDILNTQNGDLISFLTLSIVKTVNLKLSDISNITLSSGYLSSTILTYLTQEALKAKPASQWTLNDLISASFPMINSFTDTDIKSIVGNLGLDAIKLIYSKAYQNSASLSSTMSVSLVEALRIYLIKQYGTDVTKYINGIDRATMNALPTSSLTYFSSSEIDNLFKSPVADIVANKLVSDTLSNCIQYPTAIGRKLATGLLSYFNYNLSPVLNEVHLDRLGACMSTFQEIIVIQSITTKAFINRVNFFQEIRTILYGSEINSFTEFIRSIVNKEFSGNVNTASGRLGKLSSFIPADMFSSSSSVGTVSSLRTSIQPPKRPFHCRFIRFVCTQTFQNIVSVVKKTIQVIKTVVKVVKIILKIFKFFGKRSTIDLPFNCSGVIWLDAGITQLEPTYISSMTDFGSCWTEFGKYNDYSLEYFDTLKKNFYSSLNYTDSSKISESDLQQLDYLAMAFTPQEILNFKVTSLDTISKFGNVDTFTADQLTSFITIVKKLINNNPFNATVLSSMKHLACGLSSSDIQNLNINEYLNSITILREIQCRSTNAFSNFLQLSKQAYKPTIWSAAEISENGNIISGLTSDDVIKYLNNTLINSISQTAFEFLSADVLNTIAATSIRYLNRDNLIVILNNNPSFNSLPLEIQDKYQLAYDPGYIPPKRSSTTSRAQISSSINFSILYSVLILVLPMVL